MGRHLAVCGSLSGSRWRDGQVRAVALMLHGGRVTGHEPVTWYQPAVLRVNWLAQALHRRVRRHGVQVWNLRFGVRGWNGPEASPLADVQWALDEIEGRVGRPVVLVGHSMGARTALRAAGAPAVRGAVALAPWVPEGEPVAQLADRSVVLVHGTADRVTDPELTSRYARRIRPVARSVEHHEIPGSGHAMLQSVRRWDSLTAAGVLDILEIRGSREAVR
ncbi:alpha/beta fold hydrolase [Kineosporia sp. NBRC 101731]|uniref:alpha/beta hydrolase n=1 Tax=Kineosporia sp. NBRC 101731 TaxID=3032199 RepID=UPI0024A06AD4|nr:alpha/beta fold hydrolase [Kineosporia sp. NBRC 101731]GLY27749.1 alpha/beta hydrolase [Kineosporia sp. NBRC 101731]